MKTNFTRLLKSSTLLFSLFLGVQASAQTYTAISSGAWSSTSTWQGGNAPGNSVGALSFVTIEEGVDVNLDEDVQFNLLSSLTVNGILHSTSDDYVLDMNNGSLSGDGELDLNNIRFGTGSTMTFTGESSIDNFWNDGAALSIVSDLELNDTLYLESGSFSLASGGGLTLMSGSAIRIDDGTFSTTNGTLNNSNDYSVWYIGSNKTTGSELDGSGLTDVWVELDDNDQVLSLGQDTELEGMLHHNHGMFDLNDNSLTLMDDYQSMSGAEFMGSSSSSLHIISDASLTSALMFDEENDELDDMTINTSDDESNVELGSDLTVNGTLMLENGDFDMTSGTFTLANNSEIVLEEGYMNNDGATFNGSNAYNVTYNGTISRESGIELTGSGMNDLWVNMQENGDSVRIMNDLDIAGELNLERGGMAMNGSDLVLNGTLSTSSTGWLAGDDESDMTFNTTSLNNDTLWFHGTNHTFGDITINSEDESSLMIGNNLRVENMNMTTGGVHMWNSELWINNTGMISGANEDRYVMIDGSGSLVMNVQSEGPYTMFPVGTDGGYSPMGIQQNQASSGYFMVNAVNGVWENGTSGLDLSLTGAMVNRTWNLASANGNNSNLDLNLMSMWQEGFQVNDFDNTDAFIMHYTNGAWDSDSQTGSAALSSGTMFSIEREHVTSLSPFAVRDASLLNIAQNEAVIADVYPNPVKGILNSTGNFDEPTTAFVTDMTGNVLLTENVAGTGNVNHQIDFSSYPNGVYFVNYTNSKGTSSYRVVKSL